MLNSQNPTRNYQLTVTSLSDTLISPSEGLNGTITAVNKRGVPIIPSTILRGALAMEIRSWPLPGNINDRFFGDGSSNGKGNTSSMGDGLLWLSDLTADENFSQFHERSHVSIERNTRMGASGHLRSHEVCPKGTNFTGVVTLRTASNMPTINENQLNVLELILKRTLKEVLGRGFSHGRSRGYNRFDFGLEPIDDINQVNELLRNQLDANRKGRIPRRN